MGNLSVKPSAGRPAAKKGAEKKPVKAAATSNLQRSADTDGAENYTETVPRQVLQIACLLLATLIEFSKCHLIGHTSILWISPEKVTCRQSSGCTYQKIGCICQKNLEE